MATTDYDFLLTRNEIIESAFRKVGALSLGESLSAEMIEQGRKELNVLVKHWQNKRIFLWQLQTTTQALSASTVSYSLAAKLDAAILWIDKAHITVSSEELPLRIISYEDYLGIPDKEESNGRPTHVAYDKRARTIYVYPEPPTGTTDTLYLICVTRLKDFDVAAGSGDFPSEWQEPLIYRLAANLADNYGLPLSERKYLDIKAESSFLEAARMDRERTDFDFVDGAF